MSENPKNKKADILKKKLLLITIFLQYSHYISPYHLFRLKGYGIQKFLFYRKYIFNTLKHTIMFVFL